MTATAQKQHLEAIQKLVADATHILKFEVGDQYAVDTVRKFSAAARHVLRVFHSELPGAALEAGDAAMIRLFTEDEAEGERLMDQFWITNVWGREDSSDSIDRRCGIDLQAMRKTMEWLQVLAAKLEIGSKQQETVTSPPQAVTPSPQAVTPPLHEATPPGVASGGSTARPKKRSLVVARIADRIRALRLEGNSYREICKQLDKEEVPRPPGADWKDQPWAKAFLIHHKAVKAWMSKAANRPR